MTLIVCVMTGEMLTMAADTRVIRVPSSQYHGPAYVASDKHMKMTPHGRFVVGFAGNATLNGRDLADYLGGLPAYRDETATAFTRRLHGFLRHAAVKDGSEKGKILCLVGEMTPEAPNLVYVDVAGSADPTTVSGSQPYPGGPRIAWSPEHASRLLTITMAGAPALGAVAPLTYGLAGQFFTDITRAGHRVELSPIRDFLKTPRPTPDQAAAFLTHLYQAEFALAEAIQREDTIIGISATASVACVDGPGQSARWLSKPQFEPPSAWIG